jgi:hypothetical protein
MEGFFRRTRQAVRKINNLREKMKKVLILLLCGALTFALAACTDTSGEQNNGGPNTDVTESDSSQNMEGSESDSNHNVVEPEEISFRNAIKVNKTATSVEFTVMAWYIELAKDMFTPDELDEFGEYDEWDEWDEWETKDLFSGGKLESYGYNSDGSFTAIMTKLEHEKFIDKMKSSIEMGFDYILESEFYPNFSSINYDNDFIGVTVKISKEEYEKAFAVNMLSLMIGNTMDSAQVYCGINERITIEYFDAETGDLLGTYIYPDDIA